MFGHKIHDLYDYLERERGPGGPDRPQPVSPVSDERAKEIRSHLADCNRCRSEAEAIGRMLDARPDAGASPSTRLPGEYWTAYLNETEARIAAGKTSSPSHSTPPLRELVDRVVFAIQARGQAMGRPAVIAAGAGLAVVVAVIAIQLRTTSGGAGMSDVREHAAVSGDAGGGDRGESDGASYAARRALDDYFRKSNMLIVGVANATPEEAPDFGATARASRTLLDQGRNLRGVPMDHYSARLLADLDRIMVELANYEDSDEGSSMRRIQKGIEKENLLFKLRMREERYESRVVLAARYNPDEMTNDRSRNAEDDPRGDTLERNYR